MRLFIHYWEMTAFSDMQKTLHIISNLYKTFFADFTDGIYIYTTEYTFEIVNSEHQMHEKPPHHT